VGASWVPRGTPTRAHSKTNSRHIRARRLQKICRAKPSIKIDCKTMKIAGPESKSSTRARMPEGECMVRCIEGIEGSGINVPPVIHECILMRRGGSCCGHEPSTWLRAPLASSRARRSPSGPHYHPDRG
jgi:hypothetical protein